MSAAGKCHVLRDMLVFIQADGGAPGGVSCRCGVRCRWRRRIRTTASPDWRLAARSTSNRAFQSFISSGSTRTCATCQVFASFASKYVCLPERPTGTPPKAETEFTGHSASATSAAQRPAIVRSAGSRQAADRSGLTAARDRASHRRSPGRRRNTPPRTPGPAGCSPRDG